MNNLIIFPIIIPLLAGFFMFFIRRHIYLQRWLSMIAILGTLSISFILIHSISLNGIQTLQLGGWLAPFGITLVADMLAALLILTSSIVSAACLLYAFYSIDRGRESYYFYPFMMFLVCGVNGSFLTGDLFNLYVFFEVMLIASYVLLSLGGEKIQLRETIKYVLINIISSMLFVVAIAYLYSITGTLNMAHLSERIAMVGQDGLITTVSLLFLIVFAVKSALFLYFWLPGSYSAPPAAIAAIFAALLTKVGIYAILRMFTLIFYHQPQITHTIMIWMAALTMIFGAIGAIARWDIKSILTYNIIVAVGFIVFGIAVSSPTSLSGALFYLIHDMIAKALLFILGGAIISIAGTDKLNDISGLIRYRPLLGWLFFITALAIAGVPPWSGFVGKVLILQGGLEQELYAITVIGLFTSLLVLYSLMKVFIHSFWGETFLVAGEEQATGKAALIPASILTGFVIMMGFGAEWILTYIEQAVEVLMNPILYIDAVFRNG